MTLKQYYRSYKSVLGAIVGVVGALPLLSALLPADYAGYIFPPLGTFEPVARLLTVVIAASATFIAFFLSRRKPAITITVCVFLCIASMFIYGWSFTRYVRKVEIPSRNESVLVSIGGQKTEFAVTKFPDQSDMELLRQRGFGEEEIERLWSLDSILLARLYLWAPYCGIILFSLMALGAGVASDAHDTKD
jgi:hypothetical protein